MKKLKWEFVGYSPNGGKEYRKGGDLLIIYIGGAKRICKNFPLSGYNMPTEFLERFITGKVK